MTRAEEVTGRSWSATATTAIALRLWPTTPRTAIPGRRRVVPQRGPWLRPAPHHPSGGSASPTCSTSTTRSRRRMVDLHRHHGRRTRTWSSRPTSSSGSRARRRASAADPRPGSSMLDGARRDPSGRRARRVGGFPAARHLRLPARGHQEIADLRGRWTEGLRRRDGPNGSVPGLPSKAWCDAGKLAGPGGCSPSEDRPSSSAVTRTAATTVLAVVDDAVVLDRTRSTPRGRSGRRHRHDHDRHRNRPG